MTEITTVPDGYGAIIETFGNPKASAANTQRYWEARAITTLRPPVGLFDPIAAPGTGPTLIRLNAIARSNFAAAFAALWTAGAKAIRLGDVYAWRLNEIGQPSIHTFGIAVDFGSMGPTIDAAIAATMTAHAFVETRSHHFQLATGYDIE